MRSQYRMQPRMCLKSLFIHSASIAHVPSVKVLIESFDGESDMYFKVTFGAPSRIIRCTTIRDLKTIVHVESRSRYWRVRKTSATPASPLCVERRIRSTYLGAASWGFEVCRQPSTVYSCLGMLFHHRHTLIFVAPFTDFSKELAIARSRVVVGDR